MINVSPVTSRLPASDVRFFPDRVNFEADLRGSSFTSRSTRYRLLITFNCELTTSCSLAKLYSFLYVYLSPYNCHVSKLGCRRTILFCATIIRATEAATELQFGFYLSRSSFLRDRNKRRLIIHSRFKKTNYLNYSDFFPIGRESQRALEYIRIGSIF